jgi:hypothetical protein
MAAVDGSAETRNDEVRGRDAEGELVRRLREAGPEELAALVEQRLPEIDVAAARQLLRNPFVTREMIAALLTRPALLKAYELRRDLAACPQTPQAAALRFVSGLFWRDLMAIGVDVQVAPPLRRAADRQLVARLPGMAVGEKIAIARRSGPGVLTALRLDPSPRVIAALLESPRLTEGLLVPMVHRETTPPEVLRTVAESRRWGVRYEIRRALSRNPRTPVATALMLLPHLRRQDLAAVSSDPRLALPVRRRARLLGGDG